MSLEFSIFPFVPDFANAPEHHYTTGADVLRITAAPALVTWPHRRTERASAYRFTLDEARDIQQAKAFFVAGGGQHTPFLFPTWERDLVATATPAGGTNAVAVAVDDYATTYLSTDRLDEVGRYIYVWDTAQGLHVAKVIRATAGSPGQSVLEIAPPFPWTPDPRSLWGFARLVRMSEDQIEFSHITPETAAFELKVQTIRQAIIQDDELALASGIEVYETAPFITATRRAENLPKNRTDYSHATGPRNLHFAQADLYATRWAAWLGTSSVRIGRAIDGTISPPDDATGQPSALFPGGRPPDTTHLSLAFDQNAWEVIAYQKDAATVAVKRRFNGALVEHTFPGQSPQVTFNGVANWQAVVDGLADVICYYIRPGYNCIFARAQRDNFGVEFIAVHAPAQPLTLFQADEAGNSHRLRLQDSGFRSVELLTATYPDPPVIPPSPYVAGSLDEEQPAPSLSLAFEYYLATITAPATDDTALPAITPIFDYLPDTIRAPDVNEEALPTIAALLDYETISGGPQIIPEQTGLALIASLDYTSAIVSPPAIAEQASPAAAASFDYVLIITNPQAANESLLPALTASFSYGP